LTGNNDKFVILLCLFWSAGNNNYIYSYSRYLVYKDYTSLKESDNFDSAKIVLLSKYLSPYAMQKVLASDYYSMLNNYNIDKFDQLQYAFDEYITDEEIKGVLMGKYNDAKTALSQEVPEDAILADLNDPQFSDLSYDDIIGKYQGKVIYLDFWASWCGPCKGEMKYSPAMKEKLLGKDVAFVYFSTDKDSLAWERMIKILQISGDHYRLSRSVKKEANELFDVRYIPRYILIDKEGNVADDNAKLLQR